MTYDIVYYFQGKESEELKYSIRSAVENISFNRIFLIGDKPKWFKETKRSIYIKSQNLNLQRHGLGSVAILHLNRLLNSGEMPDEFLLFNDDFYIMRRIEEWTDYYRDEKDYKEKALKNHAYHQKTIRSYQYTEIKKPYNLHAPILIKKENFIDLLEKWKTFKNQDIDFRTLYGNLYIKTNKSIRDFKIGQNYKYDYEGLHNIEHAQFISTSDLSFKNEKIGEILRSRFDKPSFLEML